ncbi:TIGR03986 family type III CRISPR-associated RAMP protein [Thiothrix lacustris]|uniref:TIGR03986 family type III CRISPR-associated RAMP protein n=1 Tax=Thiothrix lacustris TaxID=525917 RepID=UPI0027E4BF51|nr:TIGR03986 family CRISPR-associated RAMP protein [Thiothrix lacustris]WMP16517.1 TIGR03986 family CRISPR-associated RAMP protein [Thiothrix lacustris]
MAHQPQRRNNNQTATMSAINAPYNFVPLSDTVVIPEWGEKVSHDLPFRDGVSGELELTITARTDILVGGSQSNGHVHFFQIDGGNGKYAIPGSSLRGMFRNVMEIATFSRMSAVDDKSYGLRDISKSGNVYQSRVTGAGKVKTGFLKMSDKKTDKKIILIPCDMARLDHRDLEDWLPRRDSRSPIFTSSRHKRVSDKYQHWKTLAANITATDGSFLCDIEKVTTEYVTEQRVFKIGSGEITAYPVFTGQISDCTQGNTEQAKAKKKHKDFVFYNPNPEKAIDVSAYDRNAWKDFLFIHHDTEESTNTDMSWPNHWRAEFRDGRQVPVFYLQSEPEAATGRLQIGLAYLPKLAGDFSTYDMIRHTSDKHLQEKGFDFSTLVFGRVGKEPEDALKGRVVFEPAIVQGNVTPDAYPPATILNGAKPSYFPNYIKQATNPEGDKLAVAKSYATYLRTEDNQEPQIRGWKRYPARPEYKPELIPADNNNANVQTHLHVLPKDTQFKSRVVFHNLKPEELGALLWSIHLEGHHHGLGMGKSFGAGQVTVDIGWNAQKIVGNDPKSSVGEQKDYPDKFMAYMQKRLDGRKWNETEQVRSLLAMTYAEDAAKRFKGKLEHMKLRDETGNNQFVTAKQTQPPLVLAVYDTSPIKHIPKYEEKKESWVNAKVHYDPGKQTLTVTDVQQGSAILKGIEAKQLLESLDPSEQKAAKKGQLFKSVEVEGKGNAIQIKGFI